MKIAIIINKKRLAPELGELLQSNALIEKHQITYDLFIKESHEIPTVLKTLKPDEYNAYLVGGGDGTVRTITQHLMNTSTPLIILPLGTFNLLALSLEYPKQIDILFEIIKNNKTKQIDLAEMNGELIVNHLWIGFYTSLILMRKKHKKILGNNRFFKMMFTLAKIMRPFPFYTLELDIDNQKTTYKTPLVFIGNNAAYLDILHFGEHKSLSHGLLSVNILTCKTRLELFIFIFKTLFSKNYANSSYIHSFSTNNLTIDSPLKIIRTVIDGELIEMTSPLHFTIHPKSLTVLIP